MANREQKLIDMMFAVALTIKGNPQYFGCQPNSRTADWVADQLRVSGFDTKPVGSSWGLLVQQKETS